MFVVSVIKTRNKACFVMAHDNEMVRQRMHAALFVRHFWSIDVDQTVPDAASSGGTGCVRTLIVSVHHVRLPKLS